MRFALSPLQWLATEDGWIDFTGGPPLPELCRELRAIGFDAISAGITPDMDVDAYRELLATTGMQTSPGYMSCPLDREEARPEFLSRFDNLARAHAELGLSVLYVGASMVPDGPRVREPALGVEPDETRLARIAESLKMVGEVTLGHGVQACLHPHVGTWIETGEETEWLLDRVDPELLAFGPDTGHLAWAGADPLTLMTRQAERVRTMHIKDVRLTVVDWAKEQRLSYRDTVKSGLWVEPGRGDLDLHACILTVPGREQLWGIIEVDRPDAGPPLESARVCAGWASEAARW
jgi:inosose dehydratase